jgi:putative ABC transport system ATP-binding protein
MNIKIMNVSKRFQSIEGKYIESLKGINLDINYGNYLSFIGPSGSGKTTLLKIISGNLRPTTGEVLWGKHRLSRLKERDIHYLRRSIFGIVFQDSYFINDLNVQDNILLPLAINNVLIKEKMEYYNSLMNSLGIDKLQKRFPIELSGGEKRKVAIARALISSPVVLIADEPTANLDEASAKDLFNIFRNLNKMGLTIIVATHDERFGKFCKETYFIRDGRIEEFFSRR